MKLTLFRFSPFLILFIPGVITAQDIRLSVKHDHFLGSGDGCLTINETGIAYTSDDDEQHVRSWTYSDIQEIKIDSPYTVEILTYEDIRWKLNRDRLFTFEILNGAITPQIVAFLDQNLPTRLVTAIFPEHANIEHSLPVKHEHSLGGGCVGELLFGEDAVYYKSESQPQHSRFWPVESIEGLGRQSDFNLRITAIENSSRGNRRNYQFQLKGALDPNLYESLWRRIYEPKSWLSQAPAER